MLHICGVSKTFGEWYQKTNKTEDTNKLTLLAFKIIIFHNTRLETFIKLLETVSKGLFRNRSQNSRTAAIQQRVTAVLRYMELLVKPEILTSYIYKLSCGTVVCKHFASYQGYPNYSWNLILYAKG
jgi:hypothetical protein